MASQFSATVGEWVRKVQAAEKIIFQRAAQRMAHEMTDEVTRLVYDEPPTPNYPRRTGFLRASLVASTTEMPRLSVDNPGSAAAMDFGPIELVINGSDVGDTLYLGYTARYGAYVHSGVSGYGMYGHVGAQAPRPWVDLVVQRWQQIVSEVAAGVKAEAGL